MKGKKKTVLAAALLTALFITNCYRAATQSIAHDEAYSWQLYFSKPVTAIFTDFSAANHLVATLLSWIAFHLAGSSVWGMRLPTLIAGAWYFVTTYRLCIRVFSGSALLLLALCLLTLHPLILDFLVAARGHGLGLAGLFSALFSLVEYSAVHQRRRLCEAALGICFAIGCSLTLLIPSLALISALLIVLPRLLCERGDSAGTRQGWTDVGAYLIAPILAFSAVLYWVFPLHKASRENFYWGVKTWQESFLSLLRASFYHNGYLGDPNPLVQASKLWLGSMAALTIMFLIGIAVLFSLEIGKLYRFQTRPAQIPSTLAGFLLSAGTILGSICALFLMHLLTRIVYPVDRLGLYFLALFPLAALSGCTWIQSAIPFGYGISRLSLLASTVVLASFVAQFNVRFFYVWRYDADTKRILEILDKTVSNDKRKVSVGISWPLEPSVNFYRVVNKYAWMTPVDRRGPHGDYDFYILVPRVEEIFSLNDLPSVSARGLAILYRGPVSNTILARPLSPTSDAPTPHTRVGY